VREFINDTLLKNITVCNDANIPELINNRVRPYRDCWSKIQTRSSTTASMFEGQLERIIASFQNLATKTGALARGPTLNLTIIIRIARILFRDDLQELEDA